MRAGRCREGRYSDHICSDILQNAPFRSQIFRRQGGIDPPNQNPADVPGGVSVRLSRRSTAAAAAGGFADEFGRWQRISIDSCMRAA